MTKRCRHCGYIVNRVRFALSVHETVFKRQFVGMILMIENAVCKMPSHRVMHSDLARVRSFVDQHKFSEAVAALRKFADSHLNEFNSVGRDYGTLLRVCVNTIEKEYRSL